MEREESLIDALLLRFHNIVELAPLSDGEMTKEAAAAQCFQMKVETQALVRSAEDLLKLTRELKEYWLMEPLRGLKEGEKESAANMGEDLVRVVELVEKLSRTMHVLPRKAIDTKNDKNGGKTTDKEEHVGEE